MRVVTAGALCALLIGCQQTTQTARQDARPIMAADRQIAEDCKARAPLPAEYEVLPPSPDVPTERARYSGRWVGAWGGDLCTQLVVDEIRPDGWVSVIYSWGTNANVPREGFLREVVKFTDDNRIPMSFSTTGAKAEFELQAPGDVINGTYTPQRGNVSRARYTKAN